MSNFEKCEKEYLTEPEELESECDNCGAPCAGAWCSKACYKIMKADHDMDQAKDDR